MQEIQDKYRQILEKYLPEGTQDIVLHWVMHYRFRLRISRSRASKFGDYTPPYEGSAIHKISVNHDLNPFSFLVTLTHELAHLITWNKFKDSVLPHGSEWKEEFSLLLADLIGKGIFPQDVEFALLDYIKNPKASSCTDKDLYKALKRYDVKEVQLLEEIPYHSIFMIRNGMIFKKGEKKRTRYLCLNMENKRQYYVSGIAEVKVITAALDF